MQHPLLGSMTEVSTDTSKILILMPRPGQEPSIYICLNHVKAADYVNHVMHPKREGYIVINSLIFVVVWRNILYCLNLGKNYLWTIQHQIKMTGHIEKPHTSIFIGQTGCGSTHLVLELIEKEYNKDFDFIVINCPTLRENDTYHAKEWIKNDDNVWLVDAKGNLYQWIKKLSELLRFFEVLLIIEDKQRPYLCGIQKKGQILK